MQVALSALNTVFAGTTQRLTESIGGTDRFIQILHVLISVMAGVAKVIENNSVFIAHLTNSIFEALNSVMEFTAFFLTGFAKIEHSLTSSINGIINFKDTAKVGFASAKKGLIGFVENTFSKNV